jgi:hypothetical protein
MAFAQGIDFTLDQAGKDAAGFRIVLAIREE